MTGWSGGSANRTWQRDARGPDSGRLGVLADVADILAAFREAHGWRPGYVWNPAAASVCADDCRSRRRKGSPHGAYEPPGDQTPPT